MSSNFLPRALRAAFLLSGVLLLSACTTFSKDGGFDPVAQTARDKLGQEARWARTPEESASLREETRKRLAQPLTVDAAVQVALWNNPGLQATYAQLQLSEADLVAAGRLPGLRLSRLRATHPAIGPKIEELIGFNLLALLTIPARIEAQKASMQQTQADMAAAMLRVAFDTRRAYFEAVAAQQSRGYMEDVREAAGAAAELAQRMEKAGNYSRLAHLRERSAALDAQAQVARAQAAQVSSRERLTRLMGLAGEDANYKLPERLPEVPKQAEEIVDAQATAMRERLDVRAARAQSEALSRELGLSKITRYVNALDLSHARIREGDDPARSGWEWAIEIPIFDFGAARHAQAEALYMRSVNRIAETAVNAQSEVREAYQNYRTAYTLAKHYGEEIVPLKKQVSDEMLLRYNSMLVSVFELLADAREQVGAVNGAINAQRDFWLADTELRAALTGKPTGIASLTNTEAAASASAPRAGH
jgi:outer membrane protein TolC